MFMLQIFKMNLEKPLNKHKTSFQSYDLKNNT